MDTPRPSLAHVVTRRGFLRAGVLIAGSGALAAELLAACGGTSSPASSQSQAPKQLTKATLRLNFNPNAEHAPYYLGKKKGFYSDQGIDVDILPGTGSSVAVKLVGSGDSMFGVAVADSVTVGRSQKVPVVSLGVLLQNSPVVLASLKSKNITKPTDLYGKKVGTDPQSTIFAFWKAFVTINHLDASKITEVSVTGSVAGPLIAGAIDASGLLLTNEAVVIEAKGYPLNVINYFDYGVKSYGQTLFTSESVLNSNKDLAKRMALATFQSWTYTLDHVDEAINALAEAVPETDKKLETDKWTNIKKLVSSPDSKANGFGHQTLEGWTQTYNTFQSGGLIENAFDPKTIFSNIAFEK